MPNETRFVLDACALLRLLQDEPGAEHVQELLNDARAGTHHVMMHIINLGEVIYTIAKVHGWEEGQRKRGEIELLPITILPFSNTTFWKAVELKSKYAMSYADCFAAAAAIHEQATLRTSDPEFKLVSRLVKHEHL